MNISTHNVLHRWTKNFVDWIAPESEKNDDTRQHASKVLEKIKAKAEEDGLTVVDAQISGSLAKGTGLRRHLQGNSTVEGQDIDLSFILNQEKDNTGKLKCLVPDFRRFAEECYPDSEHPDLTKSSAPLFFKGKKLSYDLVPLYKKGNNGNQTLVRTDGEERKTSVLKHVEFTSSRVMKSDKEWGVVKFSHMLRLVKWWRYERQENSGVFGNEKNDDSIPSFLLDLLCAKAFDECGVTGTYPETLALWFGFLEDLVHHKKPIAFSDYYRSWEEDNTANWTILDPVDKQNNLVGNTFKWNTRSIKELQSWFGESRDRLNRALRYSRHEEDVKAKTEIVALFGSAFKNHCE